MRGVGGNLASFRKFTSQSHLFHMTDNCRSRNDSTSSQQVFCKTWTTITTFGCKICLFKHFIKFHIVLFALAHRLFYPTIIGACGYIQNSANHLNRPSFRIVVFNKLKDQRPLLEMMPKAFLNKSRSISATFSRFSKSKILLLSSERVWFPFPGKLRSPLYHATFYAIYITKITLFLIPSQASKHFLRSKLNLTAFYLNTLSKCICCFFMLHKKGI